MRDWKAFVRGRLQLPGLPPERESHIVRELAAQLEDFYREALAGGATEDEADAHARRQIGDWEQLTRDVWQAERSHARSRVERLADRVEMANPAKGGVLQMLADVLRDARYGVRQLIVGVVGNVHHVDLEANAGPTMYVPFRQDVFSSMWIVARSDRDPAQLVAAARQAVREIDPTLPAFAMTPLRDVINDSVAQRRFSMLLLTAFAATALFLAAVGIYGVVGYSVSQRTREIGVRLAIGAERRDVLALVVGGGMKLAAVGVAIGLAGALGLTQLIATMLFNVTPFDPLSYAVTAAVLLTIAAIACYVPARRAMNVDPLVAIREE